MNKNLLTAISAAIVSIVWVFLVSKFSLSSLLPLCSWDPTRFSCFPISLAAAFPYLFGIPISVILIPIIFGIFGFVFSKEIRFRQASYSFVISLLVAGVIILPSFFMAQSDIRKEAKIECERQRQETIESWRIRQETNPESIKNVYIPAPCE
ncbi:hypothetical protein A3I46_02730 [Candidatus Kaiserbacteria bacterium RIFCSPLOWO2_02_FULL_54_13]|nr:MAG: hypothetical protein UY89_C0035G0009 [Parcubacteria group bacterium GW2011_GWA1_54_9]OGG83856.1 MAG: hypothetical protein A3I46_02730 [Candidatus Kaiserbacteria bacterium RIFCSPLOWO2_02_FULL_54_13]OGG90162.1 MAG: hypothetical protein A3G12_03275 [Candidatus Kaiserbacteria bacterium RIFCSPLOWO2_12_FULL_54_10]